MKKIIERYENFKQEFIKKYEQKKLIRKPVLNSEYDTVSEEESSEFPSLVKNKKKIPKHFIDEIPEQELKNFDYLKKNPMHMS